jgi:outer membrane protein TolC
MKNVTILLLISMVSLTLLPAEAKIIDIDTAILLLNQNNMDIQARSFDVKIAERNKKTAWNALLPSLDVTTSTKVMNNPYYSSSYSTYGPYDARFDFNLDISASLGINYALGAAIKNYALLYESGEISYEMAVKGMEMNTKIQFYGLLNLEEQLKIMKKGIDLAQKRYAQAQENFRNGLIPELDVLRTRVALESQKPAYSNLQTQYDNSLMGFKVMLGIDRTQEVKIVGTLNTETYTFDAEKLIKNYLAGSLTLKALNKNLEILYNSKDMNTQYAYTPVLSLSYSLNPLSYNPWADDYTTATEAWNFNDDEGIGMGTFYLGLTFSLDNVIPGSSKNVELNTLKDQINQLKLNLQQSVLDSEVEIINTIAKLENSIEQLKANRLNVELSRKAYEMTSEAYELGTKELLDVESAQNDLLNAEATVLGEQFTYISGLLNLEYTLNTTIEEILK